MWRLPPEDADNATRWRQIKTLFTQNVQATERRSLRRVERKERGIWQRRYWEHLIRDERDLANHVDYVHINPVKHGLVAQASDWQWSSIHRYIRAGWIGADWAGEKA